MCYEYSTDTDDAHYPDLPGSHDMDRCHQKKTEQRMISIWEDENLARL